ncbi:MULTISPECIES: oxygenase MpaB family protein [unclassified Actinomadura]|uniref:oxygenase MpaB family protein n=1 Tax=unclassified Actinomadura TaxID=2626254 RepID=UPI0011ED243D|nr:oxygenase MpaB family protein [Actinomadura sp. K4S16]
MTDRSAHHKAEYTDEYMDALRLAGDPLADATVEALFSAGDVGRFNTLMRWFTTSGQELPDGLPDAARTYLEATSTPPDWVDWAVMEQARQFFIDNDVHISTALSFAAMPACYVIPNGARLLSATHSLAYPSRRMAETGQFTVYLMRPDAFQAGGRFLPAAQKVRLLHASIRRHLKQEGRWPEPVPICQEDMLGALMMFSIQVLDALHRMGIHITAEGAEAYYYAWRVVGVILGIEPDAIPPDLEAAREFSDRYMLRHMGPSPEGAHLTRQLIEMYEQVVPGTLLDPVVPALIRYLVGDTAADWLEVPRTRFDQVIGLAPALLGALEWFEDRGPWAEQISDRLGRLVSLLELSSLTRGRVMHYAIPEELRSDFGLPAGKARWTPPPPVHAV